MIALKKPTAPTKSSATQAPDKPAASMATGETKATPNKAAKKAGQLFLSVAEIAQRWGTSERHVRREIASGHLIATHFGTSVRVAQDDLVAFEALARRKRH